MHKLSFQITFSFWRKVKASYSAGLVWLEKIVPKIGKYVVPNLGADYRVVMQIIAKRTLRLFWDKHPQAETPLRLWFANVSKANWAGPADVKAEYRSADFVADNRVIFDIGGNKYRLIAHVSYTYGRVLVKFVGTHSEYDRINPETV